MILMFKDVDGGSFVELAPVQSFLYEYKDEDTNLLDINLVREEGEAEPIVYTEENSYLLRFLDSLEYKSINPSESLEIHPVKLVRIPIVIIKIKKNTLPFILKFVQFLSILFLNTPNTYINISYTITNPHANIPTNQGLLSKSHLSGE